MVYLLHLHSVRKVTLERLIRFHRVIPDADFGKLREHTETKTLIFTLKY